MTAPVSSAGGSQVQEPLESLRALQTRIRQDDEGRFADVTFDLGASPEVLASLASKLPCPLPEPIRALLAECESWSGTLDDGFVSVGFGEAVGEVAPELFPQGWVVAGDEFGNYWIADLAADAQDIGPIYFLSHDPPELFLECRTYAEFLHRLVGVDPNPAERLYGVAGGMQRSGPTYRATRAAASPDSDPELAAIAGRCGEATTIIDLRKVERGIGFTWGMYSPEGKVHRAGQLPIFAVEMNVEKAGRRKLPLAGCLVTLVPAGVLLFGGMMALRLFL